VPEGLKVGLERFRAIVPGLGGDTTDEVLDAAGTPRGDINFNAPVQLQPTDFAAFIQQLTEFSENQRRAQTGAEDGREFRGGGDI
jgi:hypothetical protein